MPYTAIVVDHNNPIMVGMALLNVRAQQCVYVFSHRNVWATQRHTARPVYAPILHPINREIITDYETEQCIAHMQIDAARRLGYSTPSSSIVTATAHNSSRYDTDKRKIEIDKISIVDTRCMYTTVRLKR